MFVARNHKGLLCNALEEKIEKGADFVCPACSGAVRFKKGKVMQPHFAHISLEECGFYRENESAEHLNLKAELFRWAVQTEEVEVEAFCLLCSRLLIYWLMKNWRLKSSAVP